MSKYKEFRTKYPQFIYHGFEMEEMPAVGDEGAKLTITYDFEIPGLSAFAPTWEIPIQKEELSSDDGIINMIFSLGMVELISYWKIACPKEVVIEPFALKSEQIAFWKSLYFNGLGEFYYTNGIEENEHDFMTIVCEGEEYLPSLNKAVIENGAFLVPVGGGKDSSVSLEILKDYREKSFCYIINPRGATLESAAAAEYGEDHIICVKRTLDANMLRLNKEGFLNGHTPFSAIVAFSATLVAYLHDLTYIVLSNESSANESTVRDSYVNHQYSKSFQFEKDFHLYEERFIGSGTYYFSLLRPLSEFQIAGFFSKLPAYHRVFKSCNAGSKENIWCGHCPKCLFVWMILTPFLSQEELKEIFSADMADDKEMEGYFDQLIGLSPEKPFECVGSRDEINAAVTLYLSRKKTSDLQEENFPYLFRHYLDTGLYEKTLPYCRDYFSYYDKEHLIPKWLEPVFIQKLREKGVLEEPK